MNPIEMVMRRRVFRAFVEADPVSVAFLRSAGRTKTEAGGWVSTGNEVPLSPQVGRIVQSKRRYDSGLVNSEAGSIPDSQYQLLGFHTMDVEVDDRFTWLGNWYIIRGINDNRTESTLCAIDYDGPPNG